MLAVADDAAITARTLEHWRQQRLLPKAQRTGQRGKHPEWSYDIAALDQLQELLRLRERSRQPDVLRAALWFRGYPVETRDARASMVAVLQRMHHVMTQEVEKRRERVEPAGDTPWDALEEIGRTVARRRGRHAAPRAGRQSLHDRERATTLLLALGLGYPEAASRLSQDAGRVERLIGVDQGRRRHAGLIAWLSGPAADGLNAFSATGSLPVLIDALSAASVEELDASRARARSLLGGIAAVSRMADALALADNVTGLAAFEALQHEPMASVWLTAFVISIGRTSEYDVNLREIVDAIERDVTPTESAVRSLAELSKGALDQRLAHLTFIQGAQVRRLVAKYPENAAFSDHHA
jgi:DNA-binding transcriptional MerR regulator